MTSNALMGYGAIVKAASMDPVSTGDVLSEPEVADTRFCMSKSTKVITRLTRKFDGDGWKYVVERIPEPLRLTFINEVSIALNVLPEAIRDVEFRLGSLYVTFHVTHDDDISQEEMEQRVEEYPFREMWRLYNQRDGGPDGLDAALQKIKRLEEDVKQKDTQIGQLLSDGEQRMDQQQRELDHTREKLTRKFQDRERELMEQLSVEQKARKASDAMCADMSEKAKKLQADLKRCRAQMDHSAQRQNELLAAIVQENKKEKEAMEREFKEVMEVRELYTENLKRRLASSVDDHEVGHSTMDVDRTEEFAKLMERMEDMTLVLQKSQEAEAEARGEIQRLSEALRLSEEARQADAITYENNVLALKQQLNAFRDTKLAEDHQQRAEEGRSRRSMNHDKEMRENETIVRQYETALENIIGTLQDRLSIVREEFGSYLKVTEEELSNERRILEEHEESSKAIRQTCRTASLELQKVFWGTRNESVTDVITTLDVAAAGAEKSSAAVKVAIAILTSKGKSLPEQQDWMEVHQQSLKELINSLRALNMRAFERQLTLMNSQAANTRHA